MKMKQGTKVLEKEDLLPLNGELMSQWLLRPSPKSGAFRLFCLPFAGVGPSAFRGWSQNLPADIEALYVHLPGRESRLREANVPSVMLLADRIADVIAPLADRPFALFGHSLGGLIAFEVVRALRRRALPAPARLFVSACRAPQLSHPFVPLHRLEDDELLRQVNERYDGSVPREVVQSWELRELFVPALRADLEALECYRYEALPPVECPITVFGGTQDRTLDNGALEAWSVHTSKEFRLRMVEGGHLYLQSTRQQLIADVVEDIGTGLAAPLVFGCA